MFENIIGQASAVSRLRSEVEHRLLPPTVLFSGPDYSGKSSAALELARALTCTGGDASVPWTCTCRSCRQQRHLMHPETLLLGSRYFSREIHVAIHALKRTDRRPVRFLLERSVRKLTRRYDSVLWEGDQNRAKKVEPILAKLDEALAAYLPDAEAVPEQEFINGLDDLEKVCGSLVDAGSLDAPVDVVRRLSAWSHVTPAGPAKVAIIENVERLGESATNALLKTLEEPAPGVFFVLTTRRRGAVLATIRSRARSYEFAPRDLNESTRVISRIFRDETAEGSSIRDYFMVRDGRGLRPLAERFVEECLSEGELELGMLSEIQQALAHLGGTDGFFYFAEELTELLRELLRGQRAISADRIGAWRDLVQLWTRRVEFYRIQPGRALEAIYYGMRDASA